MLLHSMITINNVKYIFLLTAVYNNATNNKKISYFIVKLLFETYDYCIGNNNYEICMFQILLAFLLKTLKYFIVLVNC